MSKSGSLEVEITKNGSVLIDRTRDYKESDSENEIIEVYAEEIQGLIEDLQASIKEINDR